jgi:hypothetical protein
MKLTHNFIEIVEASIVDEKCICNGKTMGKDNYDWNCPVHKEEKNRSMLVEIDTEEPLVQIGDDALAFINPLAGRV